MMKNYYSFINELKMFKFSGNYKIGDRVILNTNTHGYGDLDNKAGTITREREIFKPMTSKKKDLLDWAINNQDMLYYQIKLDEPYKGNHYYYVSIADDGIKCLEKDKDEYLRKKEDNKLKMVEFDPYGEEEW